MFAICKMAAPQLQDSFATVLFAVTAMTAMAYLHQGDDGAKRPPIRHHILKCIGMISAIFLASELLGLPNMRLLVSNSLATMLGTHLGQMLWQPR